jgi:penicillin-binding protein A
MNTPIRRIAVAFFVLFFALLLNINYVQVLRAEELNSRPDNRRVLLDEYGSARGAILLEDDTVLARSVPVDDQFKYQREYPIPGTYAAATGYYSFFFGRSALERTQNNILSGKDDRLFVRRIVDLLTGREREGGSIKLTLNQAAQDAAFDGLERKKGAVVALDPRTGAILAMATSPTFDPNPLASHDVSTQQEAWDELTNDPNKPADNRAIAYTYPPGSTFKIVTAAAALESGRYTPDTVVPAPAAFDLPQSTTDLPNENGEPCGDNGQTTLADALRVSCNTAFAGIGVDLGDDALRAQAEKFGYGSKPMRDLNAATSRFPANPDAAQTALSAIGQFDVRSTPLQVAMISAAVGNGGIVMEPYLVSEILDPQLAALETREPRQVSQAVSGQTARDLTQMMVDVVENGTGRNAQIDGIPVAGKTGTAQSAEGKAPYAWFTSFAPADDPRVAVAVVIEEAPGANDNISGGRLAAPIARAVMEAVLSA